MRDEQRLDVNYRLDADCPAVTGALRVIENSATVTVTLSHEPGGPRCDGEGPVARHTVPVLLDGPLDGRSLLDGSTAPQVRVEQTAATYE